MKKYRCDKIVFEAGRDVNLMVSEIDGVIYVKAEAHSYLERAYSTVKPPLPKGYEWCEVDGCRWIIRRLSDGSMFKWIPVNLLDEDGIRNGEVGHKYGRRNWGLDEMHFRKYEDPNDAGFVAHLQSIHKYKGFYVSCFNASVSNGKIMSVPDAEPITGVNLKDAIRISSMYEKRDGITSHLLYGADYDTVLAWIVKAGARLIEEVEDNSTSWGNYSNTENQEHVMAKTGSDEQYNTLGIYDLAGNVGEMTREMYKGQRFTIRGGSFSENGEKYPVSLRDSVNLDTKGDEFGFRIALTLE